MNSSPSTCSFFKSIHTCDTQNIPEFEANPLETYENPFKISLEPLSMMSTSAPTVHTGSRQFTGALLSRLCMLINRVSTLLANLSPHGTRIQFIISWNIEYNTLYNIT